MLFSGFLRDQQAAEKIHWLLVDTVEINAFTKLHECTQCPVDVLCPSVGESNTLAEPGAAQPFPGEQAVKYLRAGERFLPFGKLATQQF